MAGKSDKMKGRVKEAVGVLMNDKKRKREGRIDQLAGEAKSGVEKVADSVRHGFGSRK